MTCTTCTQSKFEMRNANLLLVSREVVAPSLCSHRLAPDTFCLNVYSFRVALKYVVEDSYRVLWCPQVTF